jgi:pimeloyl-ACP methyl ester carboxylesterase
MTARRWIGLAVAVAIVLVCGFAGVVLCEEALHPTRRAVPPNPDARTVQVVARDGVVLRAWLFTPETWNGGAVLVLHGIADSRASQQGLARMLLAHGYTVLAPDSRAHGESGGRSCDLRIAGVRRCISLGLLTKRLLHTSSSASLNHRLTSIAPWKGEPR